MSAHAKGFPWRRTRALVAVLFLLGIFVSGLAGGPGGSLSSLWAWGLVLVCPLGFVQAALALRMWPSVAPALWSAALILIFGRAFCAWLCPEMLTQRFADLFRRSPRPRAPQAPAAAAGVLAGTLAGAFLFRVPVACLLCPVGLTFATLYAIVNLFRGITPGWELIVFPAVIACEAVLLSRHWCGSLCPLGTLQGWLAHGARRLRPQVSASQCTDCGICRRACPAGFDPSAVKDSPQPASGCWRCMDCAEVCPRGAVRIKF